MDMLCNIMLNISNSKQQSAIQHKSIYPINPYFPYKQPDNKDNITIQPYNHNPPPRQLLLTITHYQQPSSSSNHTNQYLTNTNKYTNKMEQTFLQQISSLSIELPSTVAKMNQYGKMLAWGNQLFGLLFPSSQDVTDRSSAQAIKALFEKNQNNLKVALQAVPSLPHQKKKSLEEVSAELSTFMPNLYKILTLDLASKFPNSSQLPSQHLLHLYPQFLHIFFYRVSHFFYIRGWKYVSRVLANHTLYNQKWKKAQNTQSSQLQPQSTYPSKIQIHGGAEIGPGFVLVNGNYKTGMAVQIGKHVHIGNNVKIADGVIIKATIGKRNQEEVKKEQFGQRAPIIQDDVTILSNSLVLGQSIKIGKGSVLGPNLTITSSIPPYSKIFCQIPSPSSTTAPSLGYNPFTLQSLIGNTPLVRIRTIFSHPSITIYAKLEGQNPGGSVKDRPAYNMIKQALKRGDIKPGMKLIQPTSGNTGIALAMIACLEGLEIELVMPENSTAERVQTMEAYGAKVVLTDAKGGIQGSRDYAEEQVRKGGYKMLNQFGNIDNYMAHYYSTGPQIWKDTNGEVTHFVSSMGTTGTIMGTSMFLKQKSPQIQIVGVQPTEGSKIPGIRRWSPQYMPTIFNKERVDLTLDVSQQQSLIMMRRMAKEEGIFAGVSSGGAMAAAVRLAGMLAEKGQKAVIVSIVCDRGDRYLSSGIFAKEQERKDQNTEIKVQEGQMKQTQKLEDKNGQNAKQTKV